MKISGVHCYYLTIKEDIYSYKMKHTTHSPLISMLLSHGFKSSLNLRKNSVDTSQGDKVEKIQPSQLEDWAFNPSSVTCQVYCLRHINPMTFLSFSLFIKLKLQFLIFTSSQGGGEAQRWLGTWKSSHSSTLLHRPSFSALLTLLLSCHSPQHAQWFHGTAHHVRSSCLRREILKPFMELSFILFIDDSRQVILRDATGLNKI